MTEALLALGLLAAVLLAAGWWQAARALGRVEERYGLTQAATNEGHFDIDTDTDEIFTSARYNEIHGFPPDMKFATRADCVRATRYYGGDFRKYLEVVKSIQAADAPERIQFEYRVLWPSGEMRWVRVFCKSSRDATGRVRRRTGVVVDVTEEKQAEEALRESQGRYERVMQASNGSLWDWDVVNDRYYVSPRFFEQNRFPPDTTFSSREDFVRRNPIHPEDGARYEQALKDLFAGSGSRLAMEVRVIIEGEIRWRRLEGICFRDETGRVVRWTGSSTEIDDRKRAEEALRLSEERNTVALEVAEEGTWDWNLRTDELHASPRTMAVYGVPPGAQFRTYREFLRLTRVHPDDWARLGEDWGAAIAGQGGKFEFEYRMLLDGEVRWVRTRGRIFRDAGGAALRAIGVISDTTTRKLAEQALRESKERYELAMAASESGYWDWHIPSGVYFSSARASEMVGLPAENTYTNRKDFRARIPVNPEDWARWDAAREALFAGTGDRLAMEVRYTVDGETRWHAFQAICKRDDAGRVVRWSGSTTDVTARKLAVETLRESEARFRRMTELSADTYWEQDENLRYTRTGVYKDIAGYVTDVNQGRKRWEMDGIGAALTGSWEEHEAALLARQPFRNFEYGRLRPDGTMGYYSASGAPMFDGAGRFTGYQGVARDITEYKRFEEELRRRQEMLELAQQSARALAFEWKIGGGETGSRWSPEHEAMYGLAPGGFDGSFEGYRKLIHPEDWPAVKKALKHAEDTGDVYTEYRVVHPDGSVHWLHVQGRMFFGADGKPVRSVGFLQDVTPRKQAEESLRKMELELRRAQRLEAMGTLAGGIAHDFNNILGAILGYGEMAVRRSKKGSRLRRDVDTIMAAGERGRALVDRILAFSRSGVAERVPVHVGAVVREAIDQLAASVPDDVAITHRLRAGRAAILGDPTQVHQVVMNLGRNAAQAMPEGGTLRVSLELQQVEEPRAALVGTIGRGEHVVLRVTDAGTGIRPGVLERMFDPFFTTKGVGVGSGLGLSLVHGIVTSVGGAIDVATEIGKGTSFTVYLQRSGDAPDEAADESRPLPRGGGQRVLVVDDEEPLVRLATETLEDLGYVPTGFTSSAAALAALRADPKSFDAILTDERMPGLSGSDLIREVRRIRGRIPVVLMSGYLGMKSVEADVVVRKPLSTRDLAASMARALL